MMFRTPYRLHAEDDGGGAAAPSPAPAPAAAAPSSAPAAPAPAPGASGNIATPAPAPSPAAAPAPAGEAKPQTWPDGWRDLMAGELPADADDAAKTARDKVLAKLKRYGSPADVAKALRAAEVRLSDGSLKAALPKDATADQVAEWRKENGIPEKPEDYDLGLGKGVVLGDGDKKLLDAWVAKVHGANASPDVVKAGAAALIEVRDAQAAHFAEQDKVHMAEFEDELRAEWGAEYRANLTGIENLLGHLGAGVKDAIAGARGADGRGLMNKPEVAKAFAALAREMGFNGTVIPPAGGDLGKSVADEIAALEGEMRKDIGAWRKNSKGQARLQQLYESRDRLAKRAA